jgi:hypothetical protein
MDISPRAHRRVKRKMSRGSVPLLTACHCCRPAHRYDRSRGGPAWSVARASAIIAR